MKLYTCTVELAGSRNHVVANRVVSVPEIVVLQRIHGAEHVVDFKVHTPAEDSQEAGWNLTTERERLAAKYSGQNEDEIPVVKVCFPGFAPLPSTLAEIGITAATVAKQKREAAAKLAAEADAMEAESAADIEELLGDEPPAPRSRAKAA